MVRRSCDEQTWAAVGSAQWEATMIGLRAADILRQHFAACYAAHIASLTRWPAHFVGIIQALFALVEACGVELPDFLAIRTAPSNPAAALFALPAHRKQDEDALAALDACRWALEAFHPIVYGLTHEIEPLFDGGQQNLLLLLLWVLADQTTWSPGAADIQEVSD